MGKCPGVLGSMRGPPPIAPLAIPPLPPTPYDSRRHPSAVMMGWWEARHRWTCIAPRETKFGRPHVDLSSDFPAAQDGWRKTVEAKIWILRHHRKNELPQWLTESPAMFCSHSCNRGSMCDWVDVSRRRSLFQPSRMIATGRGGISLRQSY